MAEKERRKWKLRPLEAGILGGLIYCFAIQGILNLLRAPGLGVFFLALSVLLFFVISRFFTVPVPPKS